MCCNANSCLRRRAASSNFSTFAAVFISRSSDFNKLALFYPQRASQYGARSCGTRFCLFRPSIRRDTGQCHALKQAFGSFPSLTCSGAGIHVSRYGNILRIMRNASLSCKLPCGNGPKCKLGSANARLSEIRLQGFAAAHQ